MKNAYAMLPSSGVLAGQLTCNQPLKTNSRGLAILIGTKSMVSYRFYFSLAAERRTFKPRVNFER